MSVILGFLASRQRVELLHLARQETAPRLFISYQESGGCIEIASTSPAAAMQSPQRRNRCFYRQDEQGFG
jgi:hypothetical protein